KAEAFGRVTVEAMLAGALVIGANTEGTAELIDGKYGLLYNQGDFMSLFQKIKYAIDNQEEMKEIASLSKRYALQNFTATINCNNICKIYKELLNELLITISISLLYNIGRNIDWSNINLYYLLIL